MPPKFSLLRYWLAFFLTGLFRSTGQRNGARRMAQRDRRRSGGDALAHPGRGGVTGRLERNVHHPAVNSKVPMKHSVATIDADDHDIPTIPGVFVDQAEADQKWPGNCDR